MSEPKKPANGLRKRRWQSKSRPWNALRDARVFKDVRQKNVTSAKQGRSASANDLLQTLGVSLTDRKIQEDE